MADAAVRVLETLGVPRGAIVYADSGNGAHVCVRIDEPNDPATTVLLRRCLAALDLIFSTEAVRVDLTTYNAARIWKLYGTLSKKGDDTRDRPHRRSCLLQDVPAVVPIVPRAILEQLAALAPEAQQGTGTRSNGVPFDLPAWIVKHGLAVHHQGPWQHGGWKWVLESCRRATRTGPRCSCNSERRDRGPLPAQLLHRLELEDLRRHYEPGYRGRPQATGTSADEEVVRSTFSATPCWLATQPCRSTHCRP